MLRSKLLPSSSSLIIRARLPSSSSSSSSSSSCTLHRQFASPLLFTSSRFATLSQYYKQKQQYLIDMNPELDLEEHSWDSGSNYCLLCNEPFQDFQNHRGKREHMTIELFFEIICEYARDWEPRKVIENHYRAKKQLRSDRFLGLVDTKRRNSDKVLSASNHQKKENNNNMMNSSTSSCSQDEYFFDDPSFVPFQSILDFFEKEQRARRNSTHAIARYFVERGALYLGPKQWNHESLSSLNMGRLGELVLFEWVHPPIQRMMPHAVAGQVSAFSQQCTGYYNLGSAFDFLGLADLVDPRDLPNYVGSGSDESNINNSGDSPYGRESRLKPVGTHQKNLMKNGMVGGVGEKPYDTQNQQSIGVSDLLNNNTHVNNNNIHDSFSSSSGIDFSLNANHQSTSKIGASHVEMMYWHKGIVVRNLLGQLRWAIDSYPIHNNTIGAQLFQKEPHMIILAQDLIYGIVCEIVFLRIAEYMSRAEHAWRQLGCPVYNNMRFLEMARENQAKLVFRRGTKINELNRLKAQQRKIPVTNSNDANFRIIRDSVIRKKALGKHTGNMDDVAVDPQLEKYIQFVEARRKLRDAENAKKLLGAKTPFAKAEASMMIKNTGGHSYSSSATSSNKKKLVQLSQKDGSNASNSNNNSASDDNSESIFEKLSNVNRHSSVDKLLEIIQGSCHDGVAAVLGEKKGNLESFTSGGAMTHFADSFNFREFGDETMMSTAFQTSSERTMKNELTRNLSIRKLQELKDDEAKNERALQLLVKKLEDNVAKQKEEEKKTAGKDESAVTVELKRLKIEEKFTKKQLLKQQRLASGGKRRAGASLSFTAERLLREVATGQKYKEFSLTDDGTSKE